MNERIKALRRSLGLTQTEFGAALGINQSTVAAYEISARNPSASVIALICKTWDVSETWIRTGEGEMYAYAEKNDRLAGLVARLGQRKAEATLHIVDTVLSAVDDETMQRIWDAVLLEAERLLRQNEKTDGE